MKIIEREGRVTIYRYDGSVRYRKRNGIL